MLYYKKRELVTDIIIFLYTKIDKMIELRLYNPYSSYIVAKYTLCWRAP